MKGDKGTCVAGTIPNQVRRIKFDTKQHAQDACDFHIGQGLVNPNYTVYKCTVCEMFHFGKPEWIATYGVK